MFKCLRSLTPSLFLVLGTLSLASYGQVLIGDATFGSNGQSIKPFTNSAAIPWALTIKSSGKIVLAGQSMAGYNNATIAQFDVNGALDVSFGNGGSFANPWFGESYIFGVTSRPDGRIITVGYGQDSAFNGGTVVSSYTDDGRIDSSFGVNGAVFVTLCGGSCIVRQPDGKIIIGGGFGNGITSFFSLARFNSDGKIDSSFGGNGYMYTGFGNMASIQSLIIQTDGKILAGGFNNSNFILGAIARYNPNGSLDTTFGAMGKVAEVGFQISSLAQQRDGKIIAAGYKSAARFTSSGKVDSTFGVNGRVSLPGDIFRTCIAAAIDSNQNVVLAGEQGNGQIHDFIVVLYDTSGLLLDSVETDFGGDDQIKAMLIQNDGKILTSGFSHLPFSGEQPRFAMARYQYEVGTGLKTEMTSFNYALYPNPTNGSFIISVPETLIGKQLIVTDITGKQMAAVQLQTLNFKLETETWSAGIYLVKAGNTVKRLVVE